MRISRLLPSGLIGLMPIPAEAGTLYPISLRSAMKRLALSLPLLNSMPQYTSSVFSRKITMSTLSARLFGASTPLK